MKNVKYQVSNQIWDQVNKQISNQFWLNIIEHKTKLRTIHERDQIYERVLNQLKDIIR